MQGLKDWGAKLRGHGASPTLSTADLPSGQTAVSAATLDNLAIAIAIASWGCQMHCPVNGWQCQSLSGTEWQRNRAEMLCAPFVAAVSHAYSW